MTEKSTVPKSMDEVFAHLCDDGEIIPVPLTPDFWKTGVGKLPAGRLVSVMVSHENWTSWEMHPGGDELILMLSGSMMLHFEDGGQTWRERIEAGEFINIPKGVWHTADVIVPAKALFITPGDGTQNKAREPLG